MMFVFNRFFFFFSWLVVVCVEVTVLISLGLHMLVSQRLTRRIVALNQAMEVVKKSQVVTQRLHVQVQRELIRAQQLLESRAPAASITPAAVMPVPCLPFTRPGWGPRRGVGAQAAARPRPASLYEVPV